MQTVAELPPGAGVHDITVTASLPPVSDIFLPSGAQQPPVVIPVPTTIADRHSTAAENLFSVSDPEGDAIVTYEFEALGGQFKLNGVFQPSGILVITAPQLAQLLYVAPQAPGSVVSVRIRAFDATDWSAWATTSITIVPNHAPEITLNRSSVSRSEVVALPALLTASDAEGDPVEVYEFFDARTAGSSGHFSLNSIALEAGLVHTVVGADASAVAYVGGRAPGSERLWIRAYDGYDWNAWQPWTIETSNRAPQITTTDTGVSRNQSLALTTLFSAADPDGDAISAYELYDEGTAAGSGYFALAGIIQPAAAQIPLSAAQLAQATYVGGGSAGSERLWVRAFDGAAWSPWGSFVATTS
jgi:hypothetical protein